MIKDFLKNQKKKKAKITRELKNKVIITPRWLEWLKTFSFIFLSVISALLVSNVLIQLVSSPFEKLIMGFVAIIYEILKIVSLLSVTVAVGLRQRSKAIFFLGLYLLFALIAILSNYGYILESVNKAETDPVVLLQIETENSLKQEIENLGIDYERLVTDEKAELDELEVWRLEHRDDKDFSLDYFSKKRSKIRTYYSTMKTRKQTAIKDLRVEYSNLRKKSFEDEALKKGKNRMFLLLGNAFGMSEESVKFKFLIAIAFMIEFGILISSPKKRLIKIKEREKLVPTRKLVPRKPEPLDTYPLKSDTLILENLVEVEKEKETLVETDKEKVKEKEQEKKPVIKKRRIKEHSLKEITNLIYSNRLRVDNGEVILTEKDRERFDSKEVKALIKRCCTLQGKSGLPFLSLDNNALKKNYTKEYFLKSVT